MDSSPSSPTTPSHPHEKGDKLAAGESAPLLPMGDNTLLVPYEGCAPCNPTHWSHRYFFLFLISFLCFGNYFVYDNPAALQDQFEKASMQ